MNEMIVKQKQSKQVKLLLMAILMVAASFFCARFRLNTPFWRLFQIVGVVGVVFFGFCLVFITMRLIRPKTILIVNGEGVTDCSSAISTGFLPWRDIAGVEVTDMAGQRFVSIRLHDVDAYLEAVPALKATAVKANLALGYPPVSITLQTADHTIDQVMEAMEYFHSGREYGR